MFSVPKLDKQLSNKDEVLSLVFRQHSDKPLAIATDFLLEQPLYQDHIDDLNFVVLTDRSGANRIYESKETTFKQ